MSTVSPVLVTVDPPKTANDAADARGTSCAEVDAVTQGFSLPKGLTDARVGDAGRSALEPCVDGAKAELPPALLPPLHPARSARIEIALSV